MKLVSGLASGLMALCLVACGTTDEEPRTISKDAPIVSAPAGSLQGMRDRGSVVFRGIPYAMPPTGDRRWRAPQPLPAWEGVREAVTHGPACIQPAKEPGLYFTEPPEMSEDCLLLDVTAPENAEDAPVMVWIHGGTLI